MVRQDKDIFGKVGELGLAEGDYIVVGGGLLVALGLIGWDGDIDLAVTEPVYRRFEEAGWQVDSWAGKPVLKQDPFDIGVGFGSWSTEELASDALVIQGVPFISPTKLLLWKRQIGREKDRLHVLLLERYLEGKLS